MEKWRLLWPEQGDDSILNKAKNCIIFKFMLNLIRTKIKLI
ncbi:MAG: hypothetical protein ACD_2C00018G0004 [uncultured bacterium (gcode 4)]|uniref:Uncharacterized protein n=1 Tax=uncultured bacterium (gcode 4) TaxID=1234023 RepID=K2FGH4_9BACT|nr:MAG: hypothetical protein ACD_2C00018G0004 [uncultured bacterium (gcode 4)]